MLYSHAIIPDGIRGAPPTGKGVHAARPDPLLFCGANNMAGKTGRWPSDTSSPPRSPRTTRFLPTIGLKLNLQLHRGLIVIDLAYVHGERAKPAEAAFSWPAALAFWNLAQQGHEQGVKI